MEQLDGEDCVVRSRTYCRQKRTGFSDSIRVVNISLCDNDRCFQRDIQNIDCILVHCILANSNIME